MTPNNDMYSTDFGAIFSQEYELINRKNMQFLNIDQ